MSSRSASAKPRSPNLVAQYSEARALAALPASEATKTRWPESRSAHASTSARAMRTGASRLTRRARPISSWE